MTSTQPHLYLAKVKPYIGGVLISIVGASAAYSLASHYQTPVMLFALLLGLACSFLYSYPRYQKGVEWVAKTCLRVGVALLGLRIVFSDTLSGGVVAPLIVLSAMVTTFLGGALIGQLSGVSRAFSRLSAGAVAVCGVSAAIAIAAILPNRKNASEELTIVVISVTILSTIAMILYPIIATQLAFTDVMAGIFIGGSIHDVAQVVGAGYSVSEETGDTAAYIKLMRVALLLPVVAIIGVVSRREVKAENTPPLLPGFLIAFLVIAGIHSLGVVPTLIDEVGNSLSRICLVTAIFAIGVKTRLGEIFKIGWMPFFIIVSETIIMATVIIAGLLIFY